MRLPLLIIAVVILTGCAPGLHDKISVATFPPPKTSLQEDQRPGKVNIGSVKDSRPHSAVCSISGRLIEPETPVTISTQMAAEQYLKVKGFAITQFTAPTTLNIEIKKMLVTVTPQFPLTEIRAEVQIGTEVLRDGKKKLSGTYSGLASGKDPFGRQHIIEETLGNALAEAMMALSNDQKFRAITAP